MDDYFLKAVREYNCIVEEACNLLIDYIESTEQIAILSKYHLFKYFRNSGKYDSYRRQHILQAWEWDDGCQE